MHEVGQQDPLAGEVPERKTHVALGVGGAEIDHRQDLPAGTVPGERDEPLAGRVAIPGRARVEERPMATTDLRPAQNRQETPVKDLTLAVDGLGRPPRR
jgi:hypothetical protein